MEMLNPPTMSPRLSDVYNQIAIAPAGRLAFIAGQVATDLQGQFVGAGDYAAQAEQTFRNIAGALEALQARPSQVAKMSIFVVNHRAEVGQLIMAAGKRVFGSEWPACACMMLGVQTLSRPEWLLEIDAIVSLPA
jgi:enamine deaminase RidA (YjgF/YER057c/UK114 family)